MPVGDQHLCIETGLPEYDNGLACYFVMVETKSTLFQCGFVKTAIKQVMKEKVSHCR